MTFQRLGTVRIGAGSDLAAMANGQIAEIGPGLAIRILSVDGEVVGGGPPLSPMPRTNAVTLVALDGGGFGLGSNLVRGANPAGDVFAAAAARDGTQIGAFVLAKGGADYQFTVKPVALPGGGFYLPVTEFAAPNPVYTTVGGVSPIDLSVVLSSQAGGDTDVFGVFMTAGGQPDGSPVPVLTGSEIATGSIGYFDPGPRSYVVVGTSTGYDSRAGEQYAGQAASIGGGLVAQPYLDVVYSSKFVTPFNFNQAESNLGISVRIVGSIAGPEFRVNTDAFNHSPGAPGTSIVLPARPEAVAFADGSFAVVWVELASGLTPGSVADDSWNIMARFFGASGVALGNEILVNAQAGDPAISYSLATEFLTVALPGNRLGVVFNHHDIGAGQEFSTSDLKLAVVNPATGGVITQVLADGPGAQYVMHDLTTGLERAADGSLMLRYYDSTLGIVLARFVEPDAGATVATGGTAAESLVLGSTSDWYDAGDGADTINGAGGNDRLWGGAGADVLAGGAGNDSLSGGTGNDKLKGGGGADTLQGGLGADTLSGGAGADIFRYATASEGGDMIADFTTLTDRIELSASGFGGGLLPGALAPAQFVANTTGLADAPAGSGQVVWETDASILWWDADGAGGAAALPIATLRNGASLAIGDIQVIA